jgi:hypothetical protein
VYADRSRVATDFQTTATAVGRPFVDKVWWAGMSGSLTHFRLKYCLSTSTTHSVLMCGFVAVVTTSADGRFSVHK